ncbi:MAG: amidohydrolase family protein [Betaproteobacteria bacterium]
MGSRRLFMKKVAATGITFCSCCILDAKAQYAPGKNDPALKDAGNDKSLSHRHPLAGTKHKPVIINGRRIPVIDTHAHCFFPEAIALLPANANLNAAVKGGPNHYIPVSDDAALKSRIENMDAKGVDMEVLSINNFWYTMDRETATKVCEINNRNLAQVCAAYPKRFSAFACIATQFPDLAIQQLEEAMKNPCFKGATIQANVAGVEHADPRFHPIWAKVEELGATLFIHPQGTPPLAARLKGNGWMTNTIGNPLDTTIALQHLIYEGVFDKFPNLKVIAAHGGGFLGSYAPRMDHSCFISPANCNPDIVLKKKPTEYLNQIFFDALVFTPEALRHLVAQVGASQVVVGTDSPIPWEEYPIEHVMSTPLTNAQKAAILGDNASKLLKIRNL